MLRLERAKFLLQLFMPRVEDEDLEAQRRGANQEVCERESARDYHFFEWSLVFGVRLRLDCGSE